MDLQVHFHKSHYQCLNAGLNVVNLPTECLPGNEGRACLRMRTTQNGELGMDREASSASILLPHVQLFPKTFPLVDRVTHV